MGSSDDPSLAPASTRTGRGTRSFGKYHLIAELGRGGTAEVFLAVMRGPLGFNKLQVVKQLRTGLLEDGDAVSMFLDEARLAARLNHPNIVQTNEVGEDGQRLYIAMEYLEGQPLSSLLRRAGREKKPLPLHVHLRILSEVLVGLDHAHELADFDGRPLHIVHRDVSPHNVFVTYDGAVKVLDFGIAKAAHRTIETATGVIKGKVPYMAPEQATASSSTDRRADIFAVGVLLFEALTARRMWAGLTDLDILRKLFSGAVPLSPKTVAPEIPDALDAICQRALAPDPNDRYATAADMHRDLERALDAMPARASQRDVGRVVLELFAEDRERLRASVDERLKAFDEEGEEASGRSEPQSLLRLAASGEVSGSTGLSAVASGRHRIGNSDSTEARGREGGSHTATSSGLPRELTLGSRRRRMVFGFAALLAAVALGGAVVGTRGAATANDTTAEAQPGSATATQAPAAIDANRAGSVERREAEMGDSRTAAAVEKETVDLRIEVSPRDARLFLDDQFLGTAPYQGQVKRDGAPHKLRAQSSGYATKSLTVVFDKDLAVSFALEADRPARTAPFQAPKAHPPSPPRVEAAAPAKPKPTFDQDRDPWAN
jgi:serine/threonine-protein kinase